MSSASEINIPDGIIDIHCHVLPGVDDGARTADEGLELLKMAYEQGVRAVVATPHYSRMTTDDTRREKQLALASELERKMKEQTDPDFSVFLGQEIYYHEDLPRRLEDGFGWTMAGSKYILIEFDTGADFETIYRGFRNVTNLGYRPLFAHIERYPSIRKGDRLKELAGLGVIMQMNYTSLAGSLFDSEVRWCRKQVADGVIDLLGTDMHRADTRPPRIIGAMKWMKNNLPEERIRQLTRDNQLIIIQDKEL